VGIFGENKGKVQNSGELVEAWHNDWCYISMPVKKKISTRQLLTAAREAEGTGNMREALSLYQQIVNNDPLAETAWQRLMILHRKLKDYAGELKIINLALKTFETHARQEQKQWLQQNRKAASVAKSLAKSLGLMDNKGVLKDDNPVLEKWRHRKALVAKRLKKKL
jgi:tetratricopeptide (TPR) repeat protein